MGTYKGIQGYTVQSLASDPGASADTEGQVWFNSASNVWKVVAYDSGSWSAGGNLNTARAQCATGATGSTPTAALCFGGPGPVDTGNDICEEYNGTAWTEVGDLNTGRPGMGGNGTTAAALGMGGYQNTTKTEIWNGTSWTEGNASNDNHYPPCMAGTTTAGLIYGGGPSPSGQTEEFNGTTWAEGNSMLYNATEFGGNGSQTSALGCGGEPGALHTANTYDGTSWSSITSLTVGRTSPYVFGANDSSVVCASGKDGSVVNNVELWNGTSWTEVNNNTTARYDGGFGGTSSSGIMFAGGAPAVSDATEIWATGYAVQTITTD